MKNTHLENLHNFLLKNNKTQAAMVKNLIEKYAYIKYDLSNDSSRKTIIAYKQFLWILPPGDFIPDDPESDDSESDELISVLRDISNKLNIKIVDNTYDLINELWADPRSDVLVASIDDNNMIINRYKHLSHSGESSNIVNKVKNFLNINTVVDEYTSMDNADLYTDNFKGLNSIWYHGTSADFLPSIMSKGLMPNTLSNYSGIEHDHVIFLTNNLEKAKYHAEFATSNSQAVPIIIRTTIPDQNKVLPDFDIESASIVNERIYQKQFDQIGQGNNSINEIEQNPFATSLNLGVIGYKGRIPYKFIKDVIIVDDDEKVHYMNPAQLQKNINIVNSYHKDLDLDPYQKIELVINQIMINKIIQDNKT